MNKKPQNSYLTEDVVKEVKKCGNNSEQLEAVQVNLDKARLDLIKTKSLELQERYMLVEDFVKKAKELDIPFYLTVAPESTQIGFWQHHKLFKGEIDDIPKQGPYLYSNFMSVATELLKAITRLFPVKFYHETVNGVVWKWESGEVAQREEV